MSEKTAPYNIGTVLSLGLDPGIGNTGYGFVTKTPTTYRCVDYGVIQTSPNWDEASRIAAIYEELHEKLKSHYPEILCIEGIYFQKNKKTAMSTAKVIGTCLAVAKQNHIPFIKEVRPQDIKAALTGKQTASKKQMRKMAEHITGLKENTLSAHHEADAIGAAIMGHMLYFPQR